MQSLNILIVAYDWPPRNSIAAHRPYAWAKYWSEAGCKVTVLTSKKRSFDAPLDMELPSLDKVTVFEVEYGLFWRNGNIKPEAKPRGTPISHAVQLIPWLKRNKQSLLRILNLNLDVRDGWYKKARRVADEVVTSQQIDIVVSTYGPRACHFIGAHLKKNHPKLMWVADYRDLWSQDHLFGMTGMQRSREERLEQKVVGQRADLITTVSPPLALLLTSKFEKPAKVVYNGFDLNVEQVVENIARSRKIKNCIEIVYTGMIYPGRRDPTCLLVAINNLLGRGDLSEDCIRINFYGSRQPGLSELVKELKANSYVQIHGHVPRDTALNAQINADLLLLLESGASDAEGVLTGKIFEYIASGRPILSLGSSEKSEIGRVINECGVGLLLEEDVGKIEAFLLEIHRRKEIEFYNPNIARILEFSRRTQSRDFLVLLDNERSKSLASRDDVMET